MSIKISFFMSVYLMIENFLALDCYKYALSHSPVRQDVEWKWRMPVNYTQANN